MDTSKLNTYQDFNIDKMMQSIKKLEEVEKPFNFDMVVVGSEEAKVQVENFLNENGFNHIEVKLNPYPTSEVYLVNRKAIFDKPLFRPYLGGMFNE